MSDIEVWHVQIQNRIYAIALEELSSWIAEGLVLPTDSVRRNSLRWVKAGNIPELNKMFHGDFVLKVCTIHPHTEALYTCELCSVEFCRTCLVSAQNKVKHCLFCGADCVKYESPDLHEETLPVHFGFREFRKALKYPFKFTRSLFFFAIMFLLFAFTSNVPQKGGMILSFVAISCAIIVSIIVYGIISNTVVTFSEGHFPMNFLLTSGKFSLWQGAIKPLILNFCVFLVSFGFFIAISVGAILYTWQSTTKQLDFVHQTLAKANSQELNQFAVNLNRNGEINNVKSLNQNQSFQMQNDKLNNETELQKLKKEANEKWLKMREKNLAVTGLETQINNLQHLAKPVIILKDLLTLSYYSFFPMLFALLFGLFYFPTACMIAGYTRSISATLNPFLGFGTIKRMRGDYIKILVMCLSLVFFLTGICVLFSTISMPASLFWMGNLPAMAIGSFFTSYFLIVLSAILGYVLYKNLNNLNLMFYVRYSKSFYKPVSMKQKEDSKRNDYIRMFGSDAAIKNSHRID